MIDPTVTFSIANPILALVSDGTVFVDGEGHPGVITVQRFEDDQIEITVQPLTQLPYPLHLEIILDTNDLAHIKSLLEAQDRAAAQVNPSNPSDPSNCYDCRTNQTRLDTLDAEYVTLCQAIDEIRRQLSDLQQTSNRLVLFAGSDQEIKDMSERLATLETVVANLNLTSRLANVNVANLPQT